MILLLHDPVSPPSIVPMILKQKPQSSSLEVYLLWVQIWPAYHCRGSAISCLSERVILIPERISFPVYQSPIESKEFGYCSLGYSQMLNICMMVWKKSFPESSITKNNFKLKLLWSEFVLFGISRSCNDNDHVPYSYTTDNFDICAKPWLRYLSKFWSCEHLSGVKTLASFCLWLSKRRKRYAWIFFIRRHLAKPWAHIMLILSTERECYIWFSTKSVGYRAPFINMVSVNPSTHRISNHIYCNVCAEITFPVPNFNSFTVWEWISNFISNSTGHIITYPCWD